MFLCQEKLVVVVNKPVVFVWHEILYVVEGHLSIVLFQFLVEAVVLSLLGGAIGIALGLGLSRGITQFLEWPTTVSLDAVIVAFGFAFITGIFFGFYPARKAAQLDPIESLRFE